MKSTLYFFLISFLITLTSFNAWALLNCKKHGGNDWFITNGDERIIGNSQYGFDSQRLCTDMLPSNPEAKIMCSWNGQSYQFYDIETGNPIGSTTSTANYSLNNKHLCINDAKLQPTQGDLVCAWNGKNHSPFNRKNGAILSATGNGFDKMQSCLKEFLPTANEHTICSWNSGSSLYSLNGKLLSPRFGKQEECIEFQSFFESVTNIDIVLKTLETYDFSNIGKNKPIPFVSEEPNEEIGFSM